MGKYIDEDMLIRYGKCGTLVYWEDIENAPSIDIVRCGECLYWRAHETWSECERWTDDPYESAKTKADDFCSCGEREGE